MGIVLTAIRSLWDACCPGSIPFIAFRTIAFIVFTTINFNSICHSGTISKWNASDFTRIPFIPFKALALKFSIDFYQLRKRIGAWLFFALAIIVIKEPYYCAESH
jgi:hypothetical protein